MPLVEALVEKGIQGQPEVVKRLNNQELQIAREQNLAEHKRYSTTRIYTVEETRTCNDSLEIFYGHFGVRLPREARGAVKPGTKILVVQDGLDVLSGTEGVYALGKNLVEKPPS